MAIKHDTFNRPIVPHRTFKQDHIQLEPGTAPGQMSPQDNMLQNFSEDEFWEMDQLLDYMHGKVSDGTALSDHEQSFAHMINSASPNVRSAVTALYRVMDEPGQPFKRMDFNRVADAFDLDPVEARKVWQTIRNDEVTAGLQKKMGTDYTPAEHTKPTATSDRSEDLRQSIDQHQPMTDLSNYVDADLADAGKNHTLRSALETIVNETERHTGESYGRPTSRE